MHTLSRLEHIAWATTERTHTCHKDKDKDKDEDEDEDEVAVAVVRPNPPQPLSTNSAPGSPAILPMTGSPNRRVSHLTATRLLSVVHCLCQRSMSKRTRPSQPTNE